MKGAFLDRPDSLFCGAEGGNQDNGDVRVQVLNPDPEEKGKAPGRPRCRLSTGSLIYSYARFNYQIYLKVSILDGFVKSSNFCVALHPSSLRRTISTPHSSGFARLEFGAFYFAV